MDGKIKPRIVSNGIVQHHDWLPTFLPLPVIRHRREAQEGPQGGDMTYKVHIDGYNLLPYLTGEVDKSPRRGMIYFSDDGDVLGIRAENWKVVFQEQRCRGTVQIWSSRSPRCGRRSVQPADRSVRARRYHVEHVLGLGDRPHLLVLHGSAIATSSWRRSRNFLRGRSRRHSRSTMRSKS